MLVEERLQGLRSADSDVSSRVCPHFCQPAHQRDLREMHPTFLCVCLYVGLWNSHEREYMILKQKRYLWFHGEYLILSIRHAYRLRPLNIKPFGWPRAVLKQFKAVRHSIAVTSSHINAGNLPKLVANIFETSFDCSFVYVLPLDPTCNVSVELNFS